MAKAIVCYAPLVRDLNQASKQTSNHPFFPKEKFPMRESQVRPQILINILTLSNFIHQIFIHLFSVSKTKLKIRSHSNLVLPSKPELEAAKQKG